MENVTTQSPIKGEFKILAFIGNFLLLAIILINLFSLITFAATARQSASELSIGMYPDGPLMGSWFLDIFLHQWVALILGALFIATIVKEFIIKPFRKRIIINLVFFVLLLTVDGLLVRGYTTPIRDALKVEQNK
jgi:hypothetical protein